MCGTQHTFNRNAKTTSVPKTIYSRHLRPRTAPPPPTFGGDSTRNSGPTKQNGAACKTEKLIIFTRWL